MQDEYNCVVVRVYFSHSWLKELKKAGLRNMKKKRKTILVHVTEKSRYMYLSLGTAWVQAHMMPLGSSLALLSLNWVCFESSCGSQMAAAPPSLVSTLFCGRQRAKQSWSCQCLNTTHDTGLNWVTCPIPELITRAKRMGQSNWLNHPSYTIRKGKRVVSQMRSNATEGGRKTAMQDEID